MPLIEPFLVLAALGKRIQLHVTHTYFGSTLHCAAS